MNQSVLIGPGLLVQCSCSEGDTSQSLRGVRNWGGTGATWGGMGATWGGMGATWGGTGATWGGTGAGATWGG